MFSVCFVKFKVIVTMIGDLSYFYRCAFLTLALSPNEVILTRSFGA